MWSNDLTSYLGNSLISEVWQDLHGHAVGFQLQAAAVEPVPKLWSFLSLEWAQVSTHDKRSDGLKMLKLILNQVFTVRTERF